VSYTLQIPEPVRAYLRRLEKHTRRRIGRRLDEIQADPYGPNTKALTGPGGLRASRVGDYRIVYSLRKEPHVVRVERIAPRGQVYRDLP